ncbi:MAG: hypothetical protein QOJ15_943 [Bradyrhizobium sp.]|nr:hypothetical protein [Bradyrhizobium sp.]
MVEAQPATVVHLRLQVPSQLRIPNRVVRVWVRGAVTETKQSMTHRVSQLAWALSFCALWAAPTGAQELCWPQEHSPDKTEIRAAPIDPRKGDVHIYLDGSASMSGFLAQPRPGTTSVWIMNAIIQSFPAIAASGGGKALFYRAGDGRTADQAQVDKPLTDQQVREAVRAGWYNGKDAPLDVPLNQALTWPAQDVTILVTDLFLSDAEMVGESFYTLKRPLDAALRSNKAIGILGIRHSFNGAVYDIPGKDLNYAYREANSRPLMLVMIGPPARILAIKDRLDSEFLRERADQSRFILFTVGASLGFRGIDAWGDHFIASSDAVTNTMTFERNLGGLKIPQVEFSQKADKVIGRLALDDLWMKHALRPAELRVDTKIWSLETPSARKCEDRWDGPIEIQSPALTVSLSPSLVANFELLPEDAREDLGVGRYLVVSRFTLAGLQLDPVGTWLSEWGFNPSDTESLLSKKPAFFPALNLSRLGRALRDVLVEATADVPVAEIAVGVQLKR